MTENKGFKKAVKEWTEFEESGYTHGALPTSATLSIIKDALEEIQQYREIGTVEECREAVERMKPRKVIHRKGSCYALAKDGTRAYEIIQECPNCHSIALKYSYPCRCGQVLDWSE